MPRAPRGRDVPISVHRGGSCRPLLSQRANHLLQSAAFGTFLLKSLIRVMNVFAPSSCASKPCAQSYEVFRFLSPRPCLRPRCPRNGVPSQACISRNSVSSSTRCSRSYFGDGTYRQGTEWTRIVEALATEDPVHVLLQASPRQSSAEEGYPPCGPPRRCCITTASASASWHPHP
ncbi:hypothetical protein OH76DRAFT_834279 [Lentinus brumalis]|uniref:Uncharacterized protein n=1 Tax=Lentinus brumalis TaxID=2498619 RepID=A0A371D245_9APHY|nr:hypothetical protein OH76DRAFT_834279 [Polyporus brumalis]